MMSEITSKSFTLCNDKGDWIAQVVITSDGMFSAVSDYGNFSFAWRSFGDDFESFLSGLNESYFGGKMYNSLVYTTGMSKKIERACYKFADEILPALKKHLIKN